MSFVHHNQEQENQKEKEKEKEKEIEKEKWPAYLERGSKLAALQKVPSSLHEYMTAELQASFFPVLLEEKHKHSVVLELKKKFLLVSLRSMLVVVTWWVQESKFSDYNTEEVRVLYTEKVCKLEYLLLDKKEYQINLLVELIFAFAVLVPYGNRNFLEDGAVESWDKNFTTFLTKYCSFLGIQMCE